MTEPRYPAWFCLIVMVVVSLGMWAVIWVS